MFNRTKTTPPPISVSHDILQEKQNEIVRLTRQANEAVDLVSRTINSLEDINQQIDSAISEIDAYTQGLTAARASMSRERSNNAAIISNFSSKRLVPTDRLPPGCKEDLSLREKERKIIRDLEDGIKAPVENKATLNDLFWIYISNKPELKESTRTNYLYMYQKYVQDTLGKKKIASIKYSDVKAFYNKLIREMGFKPNSMEIIHTIIHPVFTLAVRDNYIRINPAAGAMADIKKSHNWEKPKRHALTIREQETFVSYMAQHKTYSHWLSLFTVLLGTGGRIGEITGLRWEDCDFEAGIIHISHNMVYRKFDGEEKAMFHIVTPKTSAGIRIIPMLSEVRKALEDEYERQKITGFNESVVDGYTGFIFKNRYGDPMSAHNVNRAIDRICNEYNEEETILADKEGREPFLIRHFSVHNLRHTFCTRFCENESNIKVIQEIMGHADIETTMNIYAEATEQKKKESFANLEGKIKIS